MKFSFGNGNVEGLFIPLVFLFLYVLYNDFLNIFDHICPYYWVEMQLVTINDGYIYNDFLNILISVHFIVCGTLLLIDMGGTCTDIFVAACQHCRFLNYLGFSQMRAYTTKSQRFSFFGSFLILSLLSKQIKRKRVQLILYFLIRTLTKSTFHC